MRTTLVVKRALAAGERVTVSMSWKLRLPRGADFQLKGGGSARLVSFFPILAWDGSGWAIDPPLRKLDCFWSTSPTADFDVRIVTPRGLRVLATGREVRPGHWRAESVRDFGLAVGSFTVRRTTVRLPKPVRVVVGLERGSGYPIGAFVSETTRALRWYSQRYGGYPWPTYTLAVMTDFQVVRLSDDRVPRRHEHRPGSPRDGTPVVLLIGRKQPVARSLAERRYSDLGAGRSREVAARRCAARASRATSGIGSEPP